MQLSIQYCRILVVAIIIILAIAWYFFTTRIPFVESTFNHDHENWLVVGDADSGLPNYNNDRGNPGGFIYAEDRAVGGVWYWFAPKKFYGNRSPYYGQFLSFQLKQSSLENQFKSTDILLVAEEEELTLNLDSNPGLKWTSYKVALSESEEWKNKKTGNRATKSEILHVLTNLNGLYIRGEFVQGDDVGSLDNVRFGQHP